MLNVALSRSRDLLILVGTTPGLLRTLPPDALLTRVMARVAEHGVTIDASRPIDVAPIVRAARIGTNAPD